MDIGMYNLIGTFIKKNDLDTFIKYSKNKKDFILNNKVYITKIIPIKHLEEFLYFYENEIDVQ